MAEDVSMIFIADKHIYTTAITAPASTTLFDYVFQINEGTPQDNIGGADWHIAVQ